MSKGPWASFCFSILIAITAGPVLATLDISVTKAVDKSAPEMLSNVVFTIQCNNAGPENATALVVYDRLPHEVTYAGSGVSHGFYADWDGNWSIGGLNAGSTVTMVITGKVCMPVAMQTIIPNPQATSSDRFGFSLSSVGSSMFIGGAYGADPYGLNEGAAHLFTIDGRHVLTVTNPFPAANDFFGYSVTGLGKDFAAH